MAGKPRLPPCPVPHLRRSFHHLPHDRKRGGPFHIPAPENRGLGYPQHGHHGRGKPFPQEEHDHHTFQQERQGGGNSHGKREALLLYDQHTGEKEENAPHTIGKMFYADR